MVNWNDRCLRLINLLIESDRDIRQIATALQLEPQVAAMVIKRTRGLLAEETEQCNIVIRHEGHRNLYCLTNRLDEVSRGWIREKTTYGQTLIQTVSNVTRTISRALPADSTGARQARFILKDLQRLNEEFTELLVDVE